MNEEVYYKLELTELCEREADRLEEVINVFASKADALQVKMDELRAEQYVFDKIVDDAERALEHLMIFLEA